MPARRRLLRGARAIHSRAVGSMVARFPKLEPWFIVAGRRVAARSRLLGAVYWFAEEDLVRRLRQSGDRFRRLTIAGLDVQVDVTDATGRLHWFHGEPYEPELVRAVRGSLGPGDVFVDVGANIGFFSVLAALMVGANGRVVAFEPHPGALHTFRTALDANRVSHLVEVVNAAVGNTPGTTGRLFMSEDSVLSTLDPSRSPARGQFGFERSIFIPQVTLDEWFEERPELRRRIAAIKIDVEGTELDVLAGMSAVLASCPGAVIFCETDAGGPADIQLKSAGYVATALDVRSGAFGNYAYAQPRSASGRA